MFELLLIAGLGYLLYKSTAYVLRSSSSDPERKKDWFEEMCESFGEFVHLQWRAYLARRDKQNEYTDLNLSYFGGQIFIDRSFRAGTLLGFKVEYKLHVLGKRVDDEEFKRERMLDERSQQSLAEDANEEFFLPYLAEHRYFFSLNVPATITADNLYSGFSPTLYQIVEKDGSRYAREYADGSFRGELSKNSFTKKGCEVTLGFYLRKSFPDSLIEENFAMLTDEQRAAILEGEDFGAVEEMLAVAALKRRLDFLGRASKQTHECDEFSIDVEKAGAALRIKWRLKQRHDVGIDLLGFRRTGGFFNDPWDENNNGTLVIHADQNNEIIEFLEVGQTNYYTLFMQWPKGDGTMRKSKAVRFQVTIAPQKEIEAIEEALERVAERKPSDPGRENMSQALKELGLVMEFQEALDKMEKTLIEQVKEKKLPQEEEENKIEFIRDAVRLQRDKYQPI